MYAFVCVLCIHTVYNTIYYVYNVHIVMVIYNVLYTVQVHRQYCVHSNNKIFTRRNFLFKSQVGVYYLNDNGKVDDLNIKFSCGKFPFDTYSLYEKIKMRNIQLVTR